jgi:hypothetical protein
MAINAVKRLRKDLSVELGGYPIANGKIMIGDGSGIGQPRTLSGDVTVGNTGVTAIGAGKVLLAMLDAGITPSHVPVFAGKITWSGSGASLATAVTGVLATDVVQATIQVKPTQAAYLVSVAPTTDTITVVLSAANTSNDAVIAYTVFRAAA